MNRYASRVFGTGSGGTRRRAALRSGLVLLAAAAGSGGIAVAATHGRSHKLRHVSFANLAARANSASRASNTLRVDGFRAARTATPNELVALDSNGKFPASVRPPGVNLGPPGKPGP